MNTPLHQQETHTLNISALRASRREGHADLGLVSDTLDTTTEARQMQRSRKSKQRGLTQQNDSYGTVRITAWQKWMKASPEMWESDPKSLHAFQLGHSLRPNRWNNGDELFLKETGVWPKGAVGDQALLKGVSSHPDSHSHCSQCFTVTVTIQLYNYRPPPWPHSGLVQCYSITLYSKQNMCETFFCPSAELNIFIINFENKSSGFDLFQTVNPF